MWWTPTYVTPLWFQGNEEGQRRAADPVRDRARARHGYDIARRIEERSQGAITFHAASLYPLLYRLEQRKWITGRWTERPGERRRRLYKLTPAGRKVLAAQRSVWRTFVKAIDRVVGVEHA
jgi:DNA-binding PadR family transcriptional regulator